MYVSVKGCGTASNVIEGAEAIEMLCDASSRYSGAEQRFQLEPDDPRLALFVGGIKGFEIEVSEMSGIAKLAQDKGPEHSALARKFLNEVGDGKRQTRFLEAMIPVD